MKIYQHIGIIGAGAWGTALALALLRAGRDVTLWSRGASVAQSINERFENPAYLPGISLDPKLKATADAAFLDGCEAYILATPAQVLRGVAKTLQAHIASAAPVVIAAKGIEHASSALLSAAAETELPNRLVAVISGPGFADEVARNLPTALTLAAKDRDMGEALCRAFASPCFRLYQTEDVVGAQLGGALKNVLAIACGIVTGKNLGDNARAALITRGIAEMTRLATAMGGKAETLTGLSGLGDLVLSCSSPQSRNMSLGIALGQGKLLADILASRAGVTEGVATASAALRLARNLGVDMPIVTAVDAVINRNAEIDAIINSLLARPLRVE